MTLRRRAVPLAAGGLLVILAAGCGGEGAPAPEGDLSPPAAVPGDWSVETPDALGLDVARLRDLVQRVRAGREGRLHSLLIARHGRLAVEEYFASSSREDVHTVQSVTKSVTSLLAGIAQDDGHLDLDSPVLDYVPAYPDLRGVDAWRDALRPRDLLAMRSDLAWSEEPYAGSDLETLNRSSGDWVLFVLDRPLRAAPDTDWQYNSGGVIVLGGIVRAAEGGDVVRFARERLFAPLGIQGERWFQSPYDGLPHTGGGLFLRARDMAKLGQLVLQEGQWQGHRVVSPDWLRESTRRVTGPLTFWRHPVYHGLLWWLFPMSGLVDSPPAEPDVVTAAGAGGQWIFVVRPLDLVVVFTADQENGDFLRPVDLLYADLLPAVAR